MDIPQLERLARQHNELIGRADDARKRLAEAIREAADEGLRQVDIVKATGYTREQIRRIAQRGGRREPDR